MSQSSCDLVRHALRAVRGSGGLPAVEWDLLIRQARRAGLLARLAVDLDEFGLLSAVPVEPHSHLIAERGLAAKHDRDVRWEVRCIKVALAAAGVTVILLKGAAYLMAVLPPARGRMFSDIDIMVPKDSLSTVEAALRDAGWNTTDLDPYDESYYRRWMHQLPPMTHFARGTAIDVHHTIIARTTRLELNAEKLFASAVPVPSDPDLKTLAPTDIVLHSAAHLLNEGDFDRGLRDLDDLNLLLRHFGRDPAFWPALLARAEELDLRRPLFYALRYTARILDTPVPDSVRVATELGPPGPALRAMMDILFEQALRPDHASCRDGFNRLALWLLYLRAHHLLMPLHILLPHLMRKAYMTHVKKWTPTERGRI